MIIILNLVMQIIRVEDNISFRGVIKSRRVTYVKSPCETYIKDIDVIPETEVKKGQLLGRLDGLSIYKYLQDIQSQIVAAQTRKIELYTKTNTQPYQISALEQDIIQSKTQIKAAETLAQTNQRLYKEGIISSFEYDKSDNDLQILKSSLIKIENSLAIYKLQNDSATQQETEEELKVTQAQIENLTNMLVFLRKQFSFSSANADSPAIVSPCDGVITAIGENSGSSSTLDNSKDWAKLYGKVINTNETIFEISDLDNIYIEGIINERDFPYIYANDHIYFTLEAYPYQKYGVFEGFIDKLYKEPIDSNGNTVYKCEIKIFNIKSNKNIKAYLGLTTSNRVDVKRSYSLAEYMNKKIFNNDTR